MPYLKFLIKSNCQPVFFFKFILRPQYKGPSVGNFIHRNKGLERIENKTTNLPSLKFCLKVWKSQSIIIPQTMLFHKTFHANCWRHMHISEGIVPTFSLVTVWNFRFFRDVYTYFIITHSFTYLFISINQRLIHLVTTKFTKNSKKYFFI